MARGAAIAEATIGPVVRLPERIEGDGLLLRVWQVDEAPDLGRAISESIAHLRPWMRFIDGEPRTLRERRVMIDAWRREWERGGDALYAILTPEGRAAGSCGLHRRLGPGGLEIGYWVGAPFTRRGIATTTAAMLTEAAFTSPAIERVEIHHDRANVASEGVPRRLRFELTGEVPGRTDAPANAGVDRAWRMQRSAWLGGSQRPSTRLA